MERGVLRSGRWLRLSAKASSQHGVVTRADLHACEVPARTVYEWRRRGLLVDVYRGVYALGHERLALTGRRAAALLAAGPEAALSHRHGGSEHQIPVGRLGPVSVCIPHSRRLSSQPRLVIHRSTIWHPNERVVARQLPTCTLPWLLVQLAGETEPARLERMVQAAEREHPLCSETMHDVLMRARNAKGAAALKAIFGLEFEEVTSREFVEMYLELCRTENLPTPRVGTYLDVGQVSLRETDLYYPDHKLVVELDGAKVHLTRRSFESDRARDIAFLASGIATVRVTWRRLRDHGKELAQDLRSIFTSRAPRTG